ncbi:MAG TPA: MmgE/PrpD family protein [Xanthobacteraceae bacterium]|nr:MmgE/PrpD family protein [Xanthobacteraceae bacterium]
MAGLTRQVAQFVAGLDPEKIPSRCYQAARTGIADCVAVTVAGASEPPVAIVREVAGEGSVPAGAPEIPSGRMLSALDAALVNGVAGHVLDYDDVALDGHTSVALTPAIFAEGWASGARGRDALAAYVAGYEVWAALMEREPGAMHERGFHPTAIWGTLSAAAACARLQRLDPEQAAHAIGIAASLAAGLVANFGTMTKSLHAGRTAQAGVLAARLAKKGYTASTDALEHHSGLLRAHSPSGNPNLSDDDLALGRDWRLERTGVNVKRYPICYATHRSIDAMLALAETHDLKPDDVQEIRPVIGETQRVMLRNRKPKNGLEAKFSIEFAMASALVARQVGLAQLTDSFVQRKDVGGAMAKVACETRPNEPGRAFAPADEVSVALRSGQVIAHKPVVNAKGSWENPMSAAEFRAKFMDCTERVLGGNRATSLYESLMALDDAPTLRELPISVH